LIDYNPSFYLATVCGAILTAQSITGLAQPLFAVGLAAWLVLGVITGVRLVRGPNLPRRSKTTLVMELAAPSLAGNTYLVVFRRYDSAALALALAAILMGVVQLARIPAYRRVWSNPGFWSFAFTYATACTFPCGGPSTNNLQVRLPGNGSHWDSSRHWHSSSPCVAWSDRCTRSSEPRCCAATPPASASASHSPFTIGLPAVPPAESDGLPARADRRRTRGSCTPRTTDV